MIDASRVLAGPFATMLLADLGADVVKVEPPSGDETRTWGPPWWGDPADRRSAYFASVNRNKRSVVLDLQTDDGRARMDRLLTTGDLLVHNYGPSAAGRLGLDTDALRARHRGLVIASVGGFTGADVDRPAYDLVAQAVSGLMSITGEPEGPPTKVGVALLDLLAGLECAIGALASLVARGSRGGSAAPVTVNLVEVGVSSLINVLGNHLASGEDPGRHGNAHPNIAPYQSFQARDGHLVIAVGNDAQFRRLLGVLGLVDREGHYATNPQRVAARTELAAWLGAVIANRERDEIVAELVAADIAAGPVNSVPEALHAMGDGWTQRRGGIELVPSPIRVDGSPLRPYQAPPLLGEHTHEILAEIGGDRVTSRA